MSAAPVIRPARPADASALAELSAEVFVGTFVHELGVSYPDEDLRAFLEDGHSPRAFARMLADPEVRAWVGEDAGGRALGYALLRPCALPHPEVRPGEAELKRLYLRREAQGAGLGARLLEQAVAAASAGRRLWLSVWEGNARAQRFYARFGFEVVGEWGFPVGDTIDRDLIMRRG